MPSFLNLTITEIFQAASSISSWPLAIKVFSAMAGLIPIVFNIGVGPDKSIRHVENGIIQLVFLAGDLPSDSIFQAKERLTFSGNLEEVR